MFVTFQVMPTEVSLKISWQVTKTLPSKNSGTHYIICNYLRIGWTNFNYLPYKLRTTNNIPQQRVEEKWWTLWQYPALYGPKYVCMWRNKTWRKKTESLLLLIHIYSLKGWLWGQRFRLLAKIIIVKIPGPPIPKFRHPCNKY